jgi:translation initiation factor 4B
VHDLLPNESEADRSVAKDRPEGTKDMSDWTRKGPLPDLPGQRRASDRVGGGYRQFEPADAGGERGERRRPPPMGDGKERDFGNWERRGPLSPVPSAGPGPLREGGRLRNNDGPRERRQSPGWGEGRSSDGSRPPRREFQERPQVDRQPTAPELDNQWRTKMRPDAATKSPSGTPDASVPSSPAPPAAAPATRPRLNLAKRTVTEDTGPATSSESSSKSNPFGAARPIDTAAREKEIEEKRTLAVRQKKEADDKAREEKRAKEAAERKESAPTTPAVEDGAEEKPRANFEILRRVGEEGEAPQEDTTDEPANGDIVDDKAVKPKEIVRDPPKSEGAWRRKSNTPAAPAETTTGGLENDGWSTVTKPVKNPKGNRRGGGPSGPQRAIAS